MKPGASAPISKKARIPDPVVRLRAMKFLDMTFPFQLRSNFLRAPALSCGGARLSLGASDIYFSVSLITISTRRFVCLPSAVSLVATGLILPKPRTAFILSAGSAAEIR